MDFVSKESRTQLKMLCLEDFVSEDSPARQIDRVVDLMDTSYFKNGEHKATGRPPYNPKDLLKLYLYGADKGICSSRKLRRECQVNMELRWLIGEIVPDYSTISDFRSENAENLTRFFNEYGKVLVQAGYIAGKTVGIDGTKIRANNSKRNNFSANKLDRHIEYIDQKLAEYITELDQSDKIETLEERKSKYESYKERIVSGEVSEVSTTDPDSRLMKQNNNGVDVSYNVQTAVDSKYKLIAGIAVTNEPNDQGQLYAVAKSVKENLELGEMTVLGDKGYYDTDDFKSCHDDNITTIVAVSENKSTDKGIFSKAEFKYDKDTDCYHCPAGQILPFSVEEENGHRKYRNPKTCKNCPLKAFCTTGRYRTVSRHKNAEHAEQNDLAFKENYELYKQRQLLCEHPFGTVKRTIGLRQFLTRGLTNVTAEAALIFLAYNLKRLRVIHNREDDNSGQSSILPAILLNLLYFTISFRFSPLSKKYFS